MNFLLKFTTNDSLHDHLSIPKNWNSEPGGSIHSYFKTLEFRSINYYFLLVLEICKWKFLRFVCWIDEWWWEKGKMIDLLMILSNEFLLSFYGVFWRIFSVIVLFEVSFYWKKKNGNAGNFELIINWKTRIKASAIDDQ